MAHLALNPGPQPAQDHRDRIIQSLEQDNRDLREQLRIAESAISTARNESGRAVSEVKNILSPLYQSLCVLFGVMNEVSSSAPINDKKRAIWESWKQKLPGKRAEFIQALLDHGEMTSAQLKVATHSGTSTVPQIIHELNKLGLIQKNGGRYSLKEL
jgi:hypothetical protein